VVKGGWLVRLWLLFAHHFTEVNGFYNFSSPKSIKFEYYEESGGAEARLGWTPADLSGKVYPIPSTYLRCVKYAASPPVETVGSEEAVPPGNAVSLVVAGIINTDAQTTDKFSIETQDSLNRAMDRGVGNGLVIVPGALSSITVTPGTAEIQTTTNYVFGFTTTHSVEVGGEVEITFDADYDLTSVGAGDVSGNTGASLSKSGNVITITLGTSISGSTSLTINNIKNPTYVQTTDIFAIATKSANSNNIDIGDTAGVNIVAGALTAASVSLVSDKVSAETEYTFDFTTDHALPATYKVSIQFDSDYILTGVGVFDVIGNAGSSLTVDGSTITVTLGESIPVSTAESLTISNVKNPTYVKTVDDFVVETTHQSCKIQAQQCLISFL